MSELTDEQLREMAQEVVDYPSEIPRTLRVLGDAVLRLLDELRLERIVNEDMAPRFRETKLINAALMNVLQAAEISVSARDIELLDAIAAARRLVPEEGRS